MPAANRPYIGGSQNNSILELTLGYNGLGRLNGDETGSVGGSNGWGTPGLFRLFNSEFGGQIAWLLPSVLLLAAGLLWLGRRAPRTDAVRAAVVIWGSWVAVTGLTFSFMAGIIHPYYGVALAPGIAGLAGLGGVLLWQRRDQPVAAAVLAVAIVAAGAMAAELLGRTAAYLPWLRWVALLGALAAAALVLAAAALGFKRSGTNGVAGVKGPGLKASRIMARTTASLAVAAALAGPLAYSLSTASTAHSGSIVSAGPAVSGRSGAGLPPSLGGATAVNGTAGAGTGTGGAGRGPGAGRGWRPARGEHAVGGSRDSAADRRRPLHVGCRRRRVQQRRRLPAGNPAPCDGRGRVQRHGPCARPWHSSSSTWPTARSTISSPAA